MKSVRPRPYLSWSQMSTFFRDPEEYKKIYIYGEKRDNRYMKTGRNMADILETDKKTDDPIIEHIKTFLPKLPKREFELEADWNGIPLFGRMDGFDPKGLVVEEDKTGLKWTQRMADKSGQITFYSAMVWIKYGKLPKKSMVCWIKTKIGEFGDIVPTGDVRIFETKRKISDLILFYNDVKKAWKGIEDLTKKEYKKLKL